LHPSHKTEKVKECECSLLQWAGEYGLILLAPASADANSRDFFAVERARKKVKIISFIS
jgi:hypothetical protein